MWLFRKIVSICLLLNLVFLGYGQGFSNKGTDFWIPYPAHIDGQGSVMGIYITSDQAATGTIQVGTQTIPFSVSPNTSTQKFIGPPSCISCHALNAPVYLSQTDGISNGAAVHVMADKPVVVYAHIIRSARSGATLVLPSNVWGKQYLVPSYGSTPSGSIGGIGTITIMAAEANTLVKISPTKTTLSGKNTPFTITLPNPGDVYQVQFQIGADISGTLVESQSNGSGCKKIAVFSSSTWSAFGCASTTSGDNLFQQLFPISAWGKNFLTAPTKTRVSDIIRIYVTDPSTQVIKTENGISTSLTGLSANGYYEYFSGQPTYLQADKPVSVVQYFTTMACQPGANIGDPEMVVLNPVEQTINNITVFSAHRNFVPSGQSSVNNCFLNIIIKTAAVNSFKINGVKPISSFLPIPGTDYSYLQEDVTSISLSNPVQNLQADSSFMAMAYGYGNVESYGYNAGTNVKDFNLTASFKNPYLLIDSAVTCLGTDFQFGIPLNFQPSTIRWDYSSAPGLVPNAGIGPVNAPVMDTTRIVNGQTLYYYTPGLAYQFTQANTPAQRDTIKLYTTSATPDGCGSTDQVFSIPVVVKEKPVANFSISPVACYFDPLQFTDNSQQLEGSISKRIWDFGDGTQLESTTASIPNKVYAAVGTGNYQIQLKVVSDIGCVSEPISKTVQVSAKPIANFSIPSIHCEKTPITLTNLASISVGNIASYQWDLDDGSGPLITNTQTNPIVNYQNWGSKQISFMVSSSTGCNSDTFQLASPLMIHAKPVPGFVVPELCLDDALAFFKDTTRVADGTTNYTSQWNFNAAIPAFSPAPTVLGTATSDRNPSIKYNNQGDYLVSLKVSSNGCVDSITQPLTVNGANPVPSFTVQFPSNLCSNDSIRIENTSTVDFGKVTRLEILWDNLDPATKTIDEDPNIGKKYAYRYPNFQNPAIKTPTIQLKAFSGAALSCAKDIGKLLTIHASPLPNFTIVPGICFEANPRQISQASYLLNNSLTAQFTFQGNGVDVNGIFNPSLAGVGTHIIQYLVQSNMGCKDSVSRPITVWPQPIAKWGAANITCEKNQILFTDSSLANYSNLISWKWNYGDGTALDLHNSSTPFNKTFSLANSYLVSLTVSTDSGCVSLPNQQSLIVHPLPQPKFTLPSICLPDGKGKFINQSSIADASESLFSYQWNFNDLSDPSASTLKEPTHRFSSVGAYPIQLKITSKDLCVDSLTQVLTTIYPQPKASFTMQPAEICVGDSIRFQFTGDGKTSAPSNWVWDLANGNSSVLQNPSKRFVDTGNFSIQLFFYNQQGCVSDTVSQPVVIHPYPVLDLGSDTIRVLEGGVLPIKPKFVFGHQLLYQWTPSTYLNSDTDSIPLTSPLNDLVYRLDLTGKGNCSVKDSIFIQVLRSPIVPNAFSPNGDGIHDTWRIKYLESYPGAEINVFNRYGQLVFQSVGYQIDWDGTVKGKPLPIGTYYYLINPKNGRALMKGSITIIK